MSKIAQKLSRQGGAELREYEFRSVASCCDVVSPPGASARQNVRFVTGRIVGNADMKSKRARMAIPLSKLLRP